MQQFPQRVRQDKGGSTLSEIALMFLLIILLLIVLLPFISLLPASFRVSYKSLPFLVANNSILYLLPSIFISSTTAVFASLIGLILAWIVAFYDFSAVKFVKILLVLPLAIPIYVNGIIYDFFTLEYFPHFFNLTPLDIKNIYGAIFVMTVSLFPYSYLIFYTSFKKFRGLVSVARLNGKSEFQIFCFAIAPNIKFALLLSLLATATESFSEFGIVQYFRVTSIVTGIYNNWFYFGNYQNAALLSLMLFLLMVLCMYFHQQIRRKNNGFLPKYYSDYRIKENRLRGPKAFIVTAICFIIIFLSLLLPMGQIIYWMFDTGFNIFDKYFVKAFINSIYISVFAASFIIVLSIAMALLERFKSHYFLVRLILNLFRNNYTIPGVIIAVGVLVIGVRFSNLNALNGSYISYGLMALIYAYVTRFLASGYENVSSAIKKIPVEISEVTNSYKNGSFKKLRLVYLPIVGNSFIVSYLLVSIDIVKELSATFFLHPPEIQTLATLTYDLAAEGFIEESSAPAFAIILINIFAIYFLSKNFTYKDGVKWEI